MKAALAVLLALLALGGGMGGCAAPSVVAAGAGPTALEYGVTAWRKGLLRQRKAGKKFVFAAPDNLVEILAKGPGR